MAAKPPGPEWYSGTGGQVDVVGDVADQAEQGRPPTRGRGGPPDGPFGLAGRPGGVDHGAAAASASSATSGGWRGSCPAAAPGRRRRRRPAPRSPSGSVAQPGDQAGVLGVDVDDLGVAVVDDVGGFLGGEPVVERDADPAHLADGVGSWPAGRRSSARTRPPWSPGSTPRLNRWWPSWLARRSSSAKVQLTTGWPGRSSITAALSGWDRGVHGEQVHPSPYWQSTRPKTSAMPVLLAKRRGIAFRGGPFADTLGSQVAGSRGRAYSDEQEGSRGSPVRVPPGCSLDSSVPPRDRLSGNREASSASPCSGRRRRRASPTIGQWAQGRGGRR